MNLADALPETAIRTLARAEDWQAAVRLAGDRLVASGVTSDAYTGEMLAAIDEHGPYIVIAPGFALAHSRPSPAVLRTGISWVSLAEPVPFGHAVNDPVRLVVGLAATDHDGHIEIMSALAGVLADESALEALLAADSPALVRELLARHAPA
ncbi:PTS sugar transporter subunit IIA [Agrococcus baldri]|uniref:Ascorbate-specific PTS system EIIA component n=1 Tax=Agrococcus baldri TaxID=153730 RepID=A0AA87RKV4_9MICO|nr:PTS sugar transporter subunit IIA [Agrococcus baldri]GEK80007.1 PTS ascorbate transporter subunit IIA [Agrococcus baldri]